MRLNELRQREATPGSSYGRRRSLGGAKMCLRAAVALAAALPQPLLACAACFGKSDSELARGMNFGILTLLAVVVFVLGSIGAFFIYLAKRAASMSGSDCCAKTVPAALSDDKHL